MLPPDATTTIGYAAAVCTTGAFVPQVLRVWRLKSASEISLTTFSVFAVGTLAWLVFGLLISSVPIILANAVTFALAMTIAVLKVVYDRRAPGAPATGSGRRDGPDYAQ